MSRCKDKTGIPGNDFYLMRRGQAFITQRLHFGEGELCAFRDRSSFQSIAKICAEKYFHQAGEGDVFPFICELYTDVMIMAPILQRLPYSFKFDWTRAHVLSWFRTACNDNIKRFFFSTETCPRSYNVDLLRLNLETLGVHDSAYVDVLVEQFKRHYAGPYLRSDLANRIFDPICLLNQATGYRLRVGNIIYRLEKAPFPGSIDLREKQAKVLGAYRVRHVSKKAGSYLEIILTHDFTDQFKSVVTSIIESSASPRHKIYVINDRISDLLQTMKFARSSWPQAKDLQNWLVTKMRPLYGSLKDFKRREKGFRVEYLENRQDSLSLPTPNFFFNPKDVDLSTFLKYMSPYKEKINE